MRQDFVKSGAIAGQRNRRVIAPFIFSNCSLTEVEMPTAYTTRPVLNFDAPEPAVSADPNASALFPTQPIYARTAKKKASNNLPLMVGLPVLAVAAGALIWGMSTNRAEAPTDPASMQTAVADTAAPATTPAPSNVTGTPASIPAPTELAVNETPAPAPVARSTAPRAAAPARPAARRAAPVTETAPDASTASSNVSATVPVAPPTVSAAPAPAVSEPAPLVIPPPAAPQPTPQPAPVDPM
jgi:hypothetical protein